MQLSRRCLLGAVVILALASGTPCFAQQSNKPNIVVMLMDNLGYGEVGVYGGGILRGAPTPIIDKLADEGMRLLNFNVEAQCTPEMSHSLLNIAKRPLPRLTLRGVGLTSKDAVS